MSKFIALLQQSIICHTIRYNFFVSIPIVHPADHHSSDMSAEVILGMNACPFGQCAIAFLQYGLIASCIYPVARTHGRVFINIS